MPLDPSTQQGEWPLRSEPIKIHKTIMLFKSRGGKSISIGWSRAFDIEPMRQGDNRTLVMSSERNKPREMGSL